MTRLSIALLGPPQISLDGEPVATFKTQKVQALLAFLAVEAAHPHRRDELTGLLWPEQPEDAARDNLRVSLYRLRQALDDEAHSFLDIKRDSIQFNAGSYHWLDVAAFTALITDCRAHDHTQLETCEECSARLAQAVALYRGEFLAGVSLSDSAAFEEWLLMQREDLHLQALGALAALAAYHEQRGQYGAVCRAARQQLALDPWHEGAHRQLMRALALSGERSAALAQYEKCRSVLAHELGVEPDVETSTLYERIRAGELSPMTLSAPTPAHSLPAQLTPFVGREDELVEIAARLRQPEVRLLTLVGAGGMGKTRLALEVARAWLSTPSPAQHGQLLEPSGQAFPDGVFFVSLAPLNAAAAIVHAIATTIGLILHGDPKQALLHVLREKRLLLILDNCEHLLDDVELVLEILQTAPHVQLIATSRERLNLRGEHVYVVEGMDYAAEDATASSAVRLFAQSARRTLPDFKLSEENLQHVLRICQLVQGMPLGLELAAAWVEMLPLETIAAEIERNADFLAFDWRDAPERQRSVRAVFDWSWQLLNDTERQMFRQFSVFRGGCTRDAALAVVRASLRVLTSLVHKSLLRLGGAQGGAGRYEIHELLRQFAAEQLHADEHTPLEARHSAFYLAFVSTRERRMARNEPSEAAAEIQGEIDNIRRAWAWAARQCEIQALDASAYTLWQFYLFTGLLSEGEQAFDLAAEGIRTHEAASTPAGRRVLSKFLAIHASLLVSQSKHDHALALAQQAVDLGQASGGVEGETLGYLVLGQAIRRKGEGLEARAPLEQAIQLARLYQDRDKPIELLYDAEWVAHVWMGSIAMSPLHNHAGAREHVTQGMRLCQTLEKVRGEQTCFYNLGSIASDMRDYAASRRNYEQALAIARQLGYPWGEACTLRELSDVVRLQGEYTLAYDLALQARAIWGRIGSSIENASALIRLGQLNTYLGNYALAQTYFDQFFQSIKTIESPAGELLDGLLTIAVLAHYTGDNQQALVYAEQSWQIAQKLLDPAHQAQALVIRGHAQAQLQQLGEAATAYSQALTRYSALGRASMATEPQAGLARIALAQGDLAQAQALVEGILKVLAEHPLAGLGEPFYVYLTCYHVLDAAYDPRAATVLQAGRRLLHEYADRISDDALRQSFLENVATHRELLRAGTGAAGIAGASVAC